jgi:basic membrane protein A
MLSVFQRSIFMRFITAFLFLVSFYTASVAFAEGSQVKPKVCMVLDKGGKDDHSFNESAVRGFHQSKSLIAPESKFVEPRNDAQIPQFLNNFASSGHCDLIIAVGFNPSSYLPPIAQKYPQKKFLALDTDISNKDTKKNILSITFEEHEGSFLVGTIAAMKSSTKKVGFIGGMDIPIIHRFEMGYEAGAKYINPHIGFRDTYVGLTPEAWNNPSKAKELALSQYNDNVDVIYQVAAASGQGVFDAAEQLNQAGSKHKHYAIGVDSNQNWINPNIILTSMVKKMDHAVYSSIKLLVEGKFYAGLLVYGLKNGGVDWVLDKDNKKFFTEDEIKKIESIKNKIIAGQIHVPDYYKAVKK